MHTGKVVKSGIALILIISMVFALKISDAKAASTKVGWVSINSGTLNVRNGPGSNYKTIGSLKNNSKVTVYSQSKNGWSQIGFKNGKAYVSSQYLRMYSYLPDKTKIYSYRIDGKIEKHRYIGKYEGWDEWITSSSSATYLVYENNKGVYTGYRGSEVYTDIAYPLKVGKSWTVGYEGEGTSKIISLNGTLKIPSGTFKNVVTLKDDDGYISYYAPNIGFIKGTYNGKTVTELVNLTKK